MKLCSICDKKIEGKWCRNCHRFVKAYEISERIYLNESHNPTNDMGCTYHTIPEKTSEMYERKAETASGTVGNRTVKNSAGKSTGKKVAAIVGVFYALVAVIGIIGNVASEKSHDFEEEAPAEFSEYPYDEDVLWDESYELDSELENLLLGTKEKMDALEQLEPAEVATGEGYEFWYYEPEQLKKLKIACNNGHFAKSLSEFDAWLEENWTSEYTVEEEVSLYDNYLYLIEESVWLSFSSYRDYYADTDFAVRLGYDTSTEQLHMVGFVSVIEKDSLELCYSALKEFEPEPEVSLEEFRERVKTILETEEYDVVYSSRTLDVYCEVKDGLYSISFYPRYAE